MILRSRLPSESSWHEPAQHVRKGRQALRPGDGSAGAALAGLKGVSQAIFWTACSARHGSVQPCGDCREECLELGRSMALCARRLHRHHRLFKADERGHGPAAKLPT